MNEMTLNGALRAYGEALNLAEPLRVRFWLERGLTLAQIQTLFLLYERDGQAVGELAAAMQARPPTVTGLTDRLEQHGFARRVGDSLDRRLVRVWLTPVGRQVLNEIRAESRSYLGQALELMGEARVAALAQLLDELVSAASAVNVNSRLEAS